MIGKACFHSLARLCQTLCFVELLEQIDDVRADDNDDDCDDLLHDL